MRDVTRNFMVGLFVFAGLTILAVLMVWFGETPSWLQRGEWTLRVVGVREIRGIGEGSPVHLNGVEVGRVAGLSFEDRDRPGRGVVISLRLRQGYAVPHGSIAKVYGATLGIGTGRIQIIIPAQDTWPLDKDGLAVISGEMASMLGEVITEDFTNSVKRTFDHIGNLAAAATPVAENLARLMEPRPAGAVDEHGGSEKDVPPNLSTAVERFDELLANLNAVVGDANVHGDVKAVAGHLRSASEELRQTVDLWKSESQRISDNVNVGIDRTEESLQAVLQKLANVADKLDASAKSLNTITTHVAEGKGTLGLVVRDPRLYEAAALSFDRLSEFLATLNRIAGKIEQDGYITVGQKTAVGTFTKDFPVGAKTAADK